MGDLLEISNGKPALAHLLIDGWRACNLGSHYNILVRSAPVGTDQQSEE
jgi:hypothetical protein